MGSAGVTLQEKVSSYLETHPDASLKDVVSVFNTEKYDTVKKARQRWIARQQPAKKTQKSAKKKVRGKTPKAIPQVTFERPDNINTEFIETLLIDTFMQDQTDEKIRRDLLDFWKTKQKVIDDSESDESLDLSALIDAEASIFETEEEIHHEPAEFMDIEALEPSDRVTSESPSISRLRSLSESLRSGSQNKAVRRVSDQGYDPDNIPS